MRIRLVLALPWLRSPNNATWKVKTAPPHAEDPRALIGCWLCADADRNGPTRVEVDTLNTGRVVVRACWADDALGVTWEHGEAEPISGGLRWRTAGGDVQREGTMLRAGNMLEVRMLSTFGEDKPPSVSVHRFTYAINQTPMLPVAAKPILPPAKPSSAALGGSGSVESAA